MISPELEKILRQAGVDPNMNRNKKQILQEEINPSTRLQVIKSGLDIDKCLHLIYAWTSSKIIDFNEFEDLLAEVVKKVYSKL